MLFEMLSCGKRFDYEKYYGICPKCGAFHRKEDPQEAHEARDSGFSEEGFGSAPGARLDFSGQSARKDKPRRRRRVFVPVCIALLAASVGGTVLAGKIQEKRIWEERMLPEELSIQQRSYGEAFSMGVRTLTVEGVRVLEEADVQPEFPAGREAVLEDVLLIRDGIESFDLVYQCGYDGEEIRCAVEVPR